MQKTQTTCLIILATIATGFSLAYLKTVLLPFIIALFLVIGCRPILDFVQNKLNLPRFFAFIVTFLLGVAFLVGFGFLTWMSINDLAKNSKVYKEGLEDIAAWVVERLPDSDKATVKDPVILTEPPITSENTGEEVESVTAHPTQAVQEFLSFATSYVQTQMLSLAGSLSSLFSYGILILIFVFFLLMGNSQLASGKSGGKAKPTGIVGEIEAQIRKYLVMKTMISLLTGFAFGFILWLFGVPLAILFGFLAFLLNYIPNIGPLISSVLPVPLLVLSVTVSPPAMSPTAAIVCFLLISSIQFVSGNVVETRIMGKSFDVSPVFLLLALMFFAMIWGIVGMFLATPIVSILKIALQQTQVGRPVAELMAGRWNF